jgi:hypothetical protein
MTSELIKELFDEYRRNLKKILFPSPTGPAYALHHTGILNRWNIYAPDQEDKKPVISIEANAEVARQVLLSLNNGAGVPVGCFEVI